MKEPCNDFGREIRRLRCEGSFKYTQNQLAEFAGIKASYISQLETGAKKPTPQVIRRLSPHLGVTVNYLLRIIGMAEMDLVRTLADHRNQIKSQMPGLKTEQVEEIANYLTYLDFKSSVLK